MTVQEAIKELQVAYLGDTFDLMTAKHEAIKALEKQIPKKPIWIERSFTKFQVCPCCSNAEHYPMVFKTQKYCSECGQLLDWGEEDD